jgi:uncharacterized protein (TIGR04222 family)
MKAGLPIAQDIEADLKKRQLLHAGGPTPCSVLAAIIMASPLVLGLAKIVVGASRGRPVEFLVMACVATAVLALLFLLAHSRRTARGQALFESIRDDNTKPVSVLQTNVSTMTPIDVAMTIGLFGAGMLAAGPLEKVHGMLKRNSGGGGCGSTDSGGGGGGCGGGGCGGGGCGGGCGGCGS